jgi:hypothetical protein
MIVRSIAPLLMGFVVMLAMGWWVFPLLLYTSEAQPAQFSHKVHAGEQVGLPCESCHEFAEDGQFKGIPSVLKCAECHSSQLGTTEGERILVEEFVTPNKEIPWKVYSRQPDNAYFPHGPHVKLAALSCEGCHGSHGESTHLRVFQANRISGYSRDIWGPSISGIPSNTWEGMKMDRCVRCHAEHKRTDSCIDCHK